MVSALTCLVLLPFLPIVALIIKMQSPGPLFFVQNRTGLNGHTFKCYKFRSMHVNNEADTLQATKDDPRKFPFGEFMSRFVLIRSSRSSAPVLTLLAVSKKLDAIRSTPYFRFGCPRTQYHVRKLYIRHRHDHVAFPADGPSHLGDPFERYVPARAQGRESVGGVAGRGLFQQDQLGLARLCGPLRGEFAALAPARPAAEAQAVKQLRFRHL